MTVRSIATLRVHPRNSAIYGDDADSELMESIRTKGILNPLLIAENGIIISGHRRWDAARKVGLVEVPVILFGSSDEIDILEALVESNRQRAKTNEQLGREAAVLLEIEHERAKQRQAVRSIDGLLGAISPEVNGRARAKVADTLGIGQRKAEKAAEVVKVIDRLEASEEPHDKREARQLRTTLNKKSVHQAFEQARANGHIEVTPRRQAKSEPQVMFSIPQWEALSQDEQADILDRAGVMPTKKKMNFQDEDSIEWALWSWNPITGCYHDCIYCYARDIANRLYPQKFEATLLPDRLSIPRYQVPPPQAEHEIGYRNVFTCSMADLFGKWVPQPWIDAVLETVRASPAWNFLFLTKFPIRLSQQTWPDNAWVGCTVDRQARVASAERAFSKVTAGIKWLSCEPLLEPLTFSSLEMFDWVVIGGQTRSTQAPEFQPKWEWVESLVEQARKAGCKVYFKSNLLVRPKEYPFGGA